jgi:DNA-binding XRE family transcriptional regulator
VLVKNMDISTRLQEERKRLGLTQEAVAAQLGATKRSVINWEGGAALPGA